MLYGDVTVTSGDDDRALRKSVRDDLPRCRRIVIDAYVQHVEIAGHTFERPDVAATDSVDCCLDTSSFREIDVIDVLRKLVSVFIHNACNGAYLGIQLFCCHADKKVGILRVGQCPNDGRLLRERVT